MRNGRGINKSNKQVKEKYVQFFQPKVSVEIQCKLDEGVQEKQVCYCNDSNAEEEKMAPAPETKKVTFAEENDASPKKFKAKIAKKLKKKSTARVIDDFSSDESISTSSTSGTDWMLEKNYLSYTHLVC